MTSFHDMLYLKQSIPFDNNHACFNVVLTGHGKGLEGRSSQYCTYLPVAHNCKL